MTLALVLSGGGARGDFQVGALRYLYDRGIRPEIICGTSVGAINGAKLAEGERSPTHGLAGLEKIWLGLMRNEDMYLKEQWFQELEDSPVKHFLERAAEDTAGTVGGFALRWAHPFGPLVFLYDLITAAIDLGKLKETLDKAQQATSLYNLIPIENKLSKPEFLDQTAVATSGIKLRLAMVGLESGRLRYMNERAQMLPGAPRGHFLTASDEERRNLIETDEYVDDGIVGYVYRESALPPLDNVGIPDGGYLPPFLTPGTLYFPREGTELQSLSDTLLPLPGARVLLPALEQFYMTSTGFYFCTSWLEESRAVQQSGGLRLERVLGYVHRDHVAGTVPLYRLYSNDGFYYTAKAEERDEALVQQGYAYDGVVCHVFPSPGEGLIPLYRLKASKTNVDADLVDGVLASAAIPAIFRAIQINGEHYVDGGVREVLPIRAAVELGATQILGVEASAPISPLSRPLGQGSPKLLDIATRAVMDILIDEVTHNEIHPVGKGWGVPLRVIQPRFDVHDPTTIDPALIRITMDYGFMRAADEYDAQRNLPHLTRLTQLADDITRLRMDIHRRENLTYELPHKEHILELRERKWMLKALADERHYLGGALPDHYRDWWMGWEQKRFAPPYMPTPWVAHDRWLDRTSSRQFRIPAEAPPLGSDHTLLREIDDPAVYVIYGGAKFWVHVWDWNSAQLDWANVRLVPSGALRYDLTPPADGTLLQEEGQPAIYISVGGYPVLIPNPETFNALGLDWGQVRKLPPGRLAVLPKAPLDGTLMREQNNPLVVIFYGGMRFGFPDPYTFEQRLGQDWGRVRIVPDGTFARWTDQPVEGTLLKELDRHEVYVIREGKRVHIPSPPVFTESGYRWSRVRVVPNGQLAGVPDGGPF